MTLVRSRQHSRQPQNVDNRPTTDVKILQGILKTFLLATLDSQEGLGALLCREARTC